MMVEPALIYSIVDMYQRWNGLRYFPEVPSVFAEGAGLGKKITLVKPYIFSKQKKRVFVCQLTFSHAEF